MKRLVLANIILFLLPLIAFTQNKKSTEEYLDQLADSCLTHLYSPDFFEKQQDLQLFADISDYPEAKIGAKRMFVLYYYLQGNTDSLAKYTEITLNLAKKYDDKYYYYSTWVYLLNHYTMVGMSEHAINGAEKMNKEATADNYYFGVASSSLVVGDAYTYLGLYEEAIKNYGIALKEFMKSDVPEALSEVCGVCFSLNVANILAKRYEEVFPICDKMDSCIAVSEQRKHNPANISYSQVNQCSRSIAYSRLGNIEEAKECLDKARELFEQGSFQEDYLLEAEGAYLEATGQYQAAIEKYGELIDMYGDMNLIKEKLRFIHYKAILYETIGNFQEACENYGSYITNVETLNTANAILQINEFSAINNLRSIELDRKNLEIAVERQTMRTVLVLASLLLIIALAITFFLIREHRLNARLHIAVKEAKKSDRLKSAFLANISHEIRTPLNSIVGFSNLITETDDPEEISKFQEVIQSNSDLLLQLVNDVLDLSKIESETMVFIREDFDLVPFFNNIATSFQPRVDPDKVKLYADSPHSQYIVHMDKARLNQLVSNFVSNAVKFTKEGEIRIGYICEDRWLKITVSDTGIGISKENIEKIFERFYKVDDFSQGTGLGMAICKAIVTAANGKIGINSVVGQGSDFWVWLPLTPPHANKSLIYNYLHQGSSRHF